MGEYDISFGNSFKKFRLKSRFEKLVDLNFELKKYHYRFEESALSRWQNGNRIPRGRNLIITLIKIFVNRGGIIYLHEANELMELAGLGYLTTKEIDRHFPNFLGIYGRPFQVPVNTFKFIGREKEMSEIMKAFLNRNERFVIISGMGGIGKTSLAIEVAHRLKEFFSDGVFWAKIDSGNIGATIDAICREFEEDISKYHNTNNISSVFRSIISNKRALFIFDDVEDYKSVEPLLPPYSSNKVIITTRKQFFPELDNCSYVNIQSFTSKELNEFILNRIPEITEDQKIKIINISKSLNNIPLLINLAISDIKRSFNKNIDENIDMYMRMEIPISDKYLDGSIKQLLKNIDNNCIVILNCMCTLSNKLINKNLIKDITKLQDNELSNSLKFLTEEYIINSVKSNYYSLHPIVWYFNHEKIKNDRDFFRSTIKNLISKISMFDDKNNPYFNIEILNHLNNLFSWALKQNLIEDMCQIWTAIKKPLWDSGQWDLIDKNLEVLNQNLELDPIKRLEIIIDDYIQLKIWRSDLYSAEMLCKEGIQLAKKYDNQHYLNKAYIKLGLIYLQQSKYTESLQILYSTKENNNDEQISKKNLFIGRNLTQLKKYKEAKSYINKFIKASKLNSDFESYSLGEYYMAELLYKKGEIKEAKKHYLNSLKIDIDNNRLIGIGWNYLGLALTEQSFNKMKNAKQFAQKSKYFFNKIKLNAGLEELTKNFPDLP